MAVCIINGQKSVAPCTVKTVQGGEAAERSRAHRRLLPTERAGTGGRLVLTRSHKHALEAAQQPASEGERHDISIYKSIDTMNTHQA